MKENKNYFRDANWGEAIVSYCLIYLGLGQGKESKQIKKIYELSKKTCHHASQMKGGRYFQIALSLRSHLCVRDTYSPVPRF